MMGHLLSGVSGMGSALANHLWQSTAFAAGVWLLTLLLRNNHARIRYQLWLAASLKFLLPFSLLIGLGGLLPGPRHAPAGPQPALYFAVNVAAQPFSASVLSVAAHAASLRERFTEWLPLALLAVWFCGALTVLLIWYRRWRQVAATLRRAEPIDSGRELEILRRLEGQSGGRDGIAPRRALPLRLSRALMEPGVFGILRPVLLWPERLSWHLEDEHIEAILAHEAMHARRRDNLTAALHMLVETLFWFHPLVWWMERRMVEERERACDEAVVEMGGNRETYAEGLLKACRFCVESPLACVSRITGADLNRRIRSIVCGQIAPKVDPSRKVILTIAASLCASIPILIGFLNGSVGVAQSASAFRSDASPNTLAFDVASVRENKTGLPPRGEMPTSNVPLGGDAYTPTGGVLYAKNWPLMMYIGFAYNINPNQAKALKAQLPDWAVNEGFDIEARTGDHNVTKNQMRLMMRTLLASRFKLAIHDETREVSAFALVLAKPGRIGAQLHPHTSNDPSCSSAASPRFSGPITSPPADSRGFPVICAGIRGVSATDFKGLKLAGRNVTMDLLASSLSSIANLGRPAVDHTGLKGTFDFTLEFSPETTSPTGPAAGSPSKMAGPTFTQALHDQLGLKLQSTEAPLETIVVDHVEKPSAN